MAAERLMRFAAPELYRMMTDIFGDSNLHPHDVHASILKDEEGVEVILRFAGDFSKSISQVFSSGQVSSPGEEAALFFKEAADQCKGALIADYYKMVKL